MFPVQRMRRKRRDHAMVDFCSETRLDVRDLIQPFFFDSRLESPEPLPSLPGQFIYPPSWGGKLASKLERLGIPAMLLFGIPSRKDPEGSMAYDPDGPVQQALSSVPPECSTILIADVCLCEYTDHGHCGVLSDGEVDNDASLPLHSMAAVSLAEAGADILAPSGMMDGVVGHIRRSLDDNGFSDRAVLAYSAKFNSALYGPFRDAAQSCPSCGDRSGYQMQSGNGREAVTEAMLDIEEGADMVMVKPALGYLDVVREIRSRTDVPVFAYQVSGEYSMIKKAGESGLLNSDAYFRESLISIKRAGADRIITYYAMELAESQED